MNEWMDVSISSQQANMRIPIKQHLGGGFKDFFFSPLFWEDSHFDEHVFQLG